LHAVAKSFSVGLVGSQLPAIWRRVSVFPLHDVHNPHIMQHILAYHDMEHNLMAEKTEVCAAPATAQPPRDYVKDEMRHPQHKTYMAICCSHIPS
jgi:hypothetical protein